MCKWDGLVGEGETLTHQSHRLGHRTLVKILPAVATDSFDSNGLHSQETCQHSHGTFRQAGPCLLTLGPPSVRFVLRLPAMPAYSRGDFQTGHVHSDTRRVCWPPGPELGLSKCSQGLVSWTWVSLGRDGGSCVLAGRDVPCPPCLALGWTVIRCTATDDVLRLVVSARHQDSCHWLDIPEVPKLGPWIKPWKSGRASSLLFLCQFAGRHY